MKTVAYIYPYAFQYRLEFHEKLRSILFERGVLYNFIYCENPHFPDRGDFSPPSWAKSVKCTYLKLGKLELRYQHAFRDSIGLDLSIVQQENGLLLNYLIQIIAPILGRKVAFFGHGRNFQGDASGLKEKFKAFWLRRVDWWFAYTQRSAEIVASSGFDTKRITAFNNAIDTSKISIQLSQLSEAERETLRISQFHGSDNIGVYIGGLYDLKRIKFLIESSKVVRQKIPDFQLLIIGGGADLHIAQAASLEFPWIHALGPRFGREKTTLASLGKVLLMPGLVGLSVLDSFAYQMPMVTTAVPYHSPEIDYLKNGLNGVIVPETEDVQKYADAIERILTDIDWRNALIRGGHEAMQTYTIEAMAERFADGVMGALATQNRQS